MPHLRLEYSDNIQTNISPSLFKNLISILNKAAGVKTENCKARAIKIKNFCIEVAGCFISRSDCYPFLYSI